MPKKKKAKKSKPVKKKAAARPKKTVKAKPSKSASQKKGAPQPLAPKTPPGIPGEKFLGKVEDYFGKTSVIALKVKEPLALGDVIHVLGHTTDYTQEVKSMQINHDPVKAAKKGDSIGIKASDKSRKGDNVYRVG